jgi:multidrug efflux pump subunit AcrB
MEGRRGTIRWFARNPVAANLVMLLLLVGGLFSSCTVRQEVFPDFKLDLIRISVPYPGASPAEVEQGIILAVEEAVRGVDGIDRVTSAAMEGGGHVYLSLELEADAANVLSEVKNEVDRITSLPQDAERPTVSLVVNRFEVISLVLHGEQDPKVLRDLAEQVRDHLVEQDGISFAEVTGAPPREISIDVPQAELRTHGLSLDQIAAKVAGTSIELPGGSVKTAAGEVLLRTTERRHSVGEFERIPVVTSSTGTEVTLGQLASIRETFVETDQSSLYDGEPAVMVKVFRTGDQTPIQVADDVKAQVELLSERLPAGVSIDTWLDWSEIYRQRIELLMRNALIGLALVMLILGMFLELRLAFWVTMGIPTSFLGAVLLMPSLDVSVNMISLFAFIVVLGMVVDDAIVVGENIYELRQRGVDRMKAAILGAQQVGTPVVFAIATSVVAFLPMSFVPGFSGKLYRVIPAIVISVLVISLVESLWVLPAHLAAIKDPKQRGVYAAIYRQQQKISRGLESFVARIYAPCLRFVLRRRYASVATGVAMLIVSIGFVVSGHIPFRFMPDIAGDVAIAAVEMPYGSPVEETQRIQRLMLNTAQEILDDNGEEGIVRGVYSEVGTPLPGDPAQAASQVAGGHLANVQVYFVDAGERSLSTEEFLEAWRERLGQIAGAEKISFTASIGPSPGAPVNVELQHDDMQVLELAAMELAAEIRKFPETYDVDDGFAPGKPQLDLSLTPEAVGLDMASADVARQVRSAFYGTEAVRQQEGRNEVRVTVRLPEAERRSLFDVETLMLRTPRGGEIPLQEAAEIEAGRSRPTILRAEGKRMIPVTAQVRADTSPDSVIAAIEAGPLAELIEAHPGLTYDFGGAQREQKKAMGSLFRGGMLAILAIFALLAIPFRSYLQPAIVMSAIPFGFVGALLGHVLMGFELSMISVMGLIALAGVAVNDSLVLVDAVNGYRREGQGTLEAVQSAGVRRFRPILLTSLTTFFGLVPMITETSVQAQFLVPMAISLGFGVMFATAITLLLVPAFYMILEDVKTLLGLRDRSAAFAQLSSDSLVRPAAEPGE